MRIYGEVASQELFGTVWLAFFSSSRLCIFALVSSYFAVLLMSVFVVSSALLSLPFSLLSYFWSARAKGRDSTSARIKSK